MKNIFLLSLFLFNFTHAGISQYVTPGTVTRGIIASTGLAAATSVTVAVKAAAVAAETIISACFVYLMGIVPF